MSGYKLLDEFLLCAIVADKYITEKESSLLKNFPINFSTPWWESESKLSAHMSYLIDQYGGDQCGE